MRVGEECRGRKGGRREGKLTRRQIIPHHKTQQPHQNRIHTPRNVPASGVKVGHARANGGIGREPSRGGHHLQFWRCERVVFWEGDHAPVFAAGEGRVGGTAEDVVPFEDAVQRGRKRRKRRGRKGVIRQNLSFPPPIPQYERTDRLENREGRLTCSHSA